MEKRSQFLSWTRGKMMVAPSGEKQSEPLQKHPPPRYRPPRPIFALYWPPLPFCLACARSASVGSLKFRTIADAAGVLEVAGNTKEDSRTMSDFASERNCVKRTRVCV